MSRLATGAREASTLKRMGGRARCNCPGCRGRIASGCTRGVDTLLNRGCGFVQTRTGLATNDADVVAPEPAPERTLDVPTVRGFERDAVLDQVGHRADGLVSTAHLRSQLPDLLDQVIVRHGAGVARERPQSAVRCRRRATTRAQPAPSRSGRTADGVDAGRAASLWPPGRARSQWPARAVQGRLGSSQAGECHGNGESDRRTALPRESSQASSTNMRGRLGVFTGRPRLVSLRTSISVQPEPSNRKRRS